MKTNELQIGDWVTDNNGMPMFVQAIYGDDTVYLDFDGNEADTWETDIEDVNPIPFTEQFLEKQGFERAWNSSYYGLRIEKFYICISAYFHTLDI